MLAMVNVLQIIISNIAWLCIWHLQYFQSLRNGCLFCTFWLIRNFYSAEAHHANYSKYLLNHHFQHCAQCVYETYSVFKVFQIAICFANFPFTKFLPQWCAPCQQWWTFFKSSFPILYTLGRWDLQCFHTFRNCCFFSTFRIIWKFNSGDASHANYGKYILNHHFQHCAHCAYDIYSICKVLEMPVCFAQFGLFEISTPGRRIMLTIANIV